MLLALAHSTFLTDLVTFEEKLIGKIPRINFISDQVGRKWSDEKLDPLLDAPGSGFFSALRIKIDHLERFSLPKLLG